MLPSVSIICLLTPSRRGLWRDFIRSVYSQEYAGDVFLEIVVEDRKDFAHFADICKQVETVETIPCITLREHFYPVESNGKGTTPEHLVAKKRNLALSHAHGQLVMNIDDDDFLYDKDALYVLTTPFDSLTASRKQKSRSNVIASVGGSVNFFPHKKDSERFLHWEQVTPGVYHSRDLIESLIDRLHKSLKVGERYFALHCSAVMFDTAKLQYFGGWDEKIPSAEDISMVTKFLASVDGEVVVYPNIVHAYRKHDSNIKRDEVFMKRNRASLAEICGDFYVSV